MDSLKYFDVCILENIMVALMASLVNRQENVISNTS